MTFAAPDHLHKDLVLLERLVPFRFLFRKFVDLSLLELWQPWFAMVFFWLIILSFVASMRMLIEDRRRAKAGLGLLPMILCRVVFTIFPRAHL